jgi:hypothetical protein
MNIAESIVLNFLDGKDHGYQALGVAIPSTSPHSHWDFAKMSEGPARGRGTEVQLGLPVFTKSERDCLSAIA